MNQTITDHAPPTLPHLIANLARCLGEPSFPAGDRAALRRMTPGQNLPLAFYRLWFLHLREETVPTPLGPWMALVWGLALMGPGGHTRDRPLGRALAEAGFAEARFEQLLEVPDDLRIPLFMRTIRFLAAKGVPFDWLDAAKLLLTTDHEKREEFHKKLASDYYAALRAERKE